MRRRSAVVSVNLIMAADADRDDLAVLQQKLQGNAVADVDGDGMQIVKRSGQAMQSQGRMSRIEFQQLQGFFVFGRRVSDSCGCR